MLEPQHLLVLTLNPKPHHLVLSSDVLGAPITTSKREPPLPLINKPSSRAKNIVNNLQGESQFSVLQTLETIIPGDLEEKLALGGNPCSLRGQLKLDGIRQLVYVFLGAFELKHLVDVTGRGPALHTLPSPLRLLRHVEQTV